MGWLTRRHPATLYTSLVVGFLIFRAILFAVTTAGEYRLYRDYGEAARATSLDELYRTRDIEYPHLAVVLGSATGVVADALPGWTARLVRWRPNKFEVLYLGESDEDHELGDRYEAALGFVLFAADLACLGLVYLVARRVYPGEGHVARVGRLAGYVVATGAIGLILYDRQDLVVGLVALLAVWAFSAGRPAAGYAVLVLGTAYKLVPVLLLPACVLAAAAVRAAPTATPGRYLRCVAVEAAVAGLILAAWPVLTYEFGGGPRAFRFLTYHTDRGLQLEAPVAWPVLLIDPATEIGHGYGSYNLRGELADRVAKPTRLLMPLAVLVGALLAARGFWRAASAPARPSFPELVPQVVAAALLIWLGFITANKVGSPQYLLWVAPLAPLLPLRTWAERGWAGLLLAAMLWTSAIFPCAYPAVIGPEVRPDPRTWAGPTAGGVFLLAARSVTLVVTTGWLAVSVWRAPRVDLASKSEARSPESDRTPGPGP